MGCIRRINAWGGTGRAHLFGGPALRQKKARSPGPESGLYLVSDGEGPAPTVPAAKSLPAQGLGRFLLGRSLGSGLRGGLGGSCRGRCPTVGLRSAATGGIGRRGSRGRRCSRSHGGSRRGFYRTRGPGLFAAHFAVHTTLAGSGGIVGHHAAATAHHDGGARRYRDANAAGHIAASTATEATRSSCSRLGTGRCSCRRYFGRSWSRCFGCAAIGRCLLATGFRGSGFSGFLSRSFFGSIPAAGVPAALGSGRIGEAGREEQEE